MDFHAPIDPGDIAVVTSYVYDIGRTSMRVRVDSFRCWSVGPSANTT